MNLYRVDHLRLHKLCFVDNYYNIFGEWPQPVSLMAKNGLVYTAKNG